jgi:hypothetical protein
MMACGIRDFCWRAEVSRGYAASPADVVGPPTVDRDVHEYPSWTEMLVARCAEVARLHSDEGEPVRRDEMTSRCGRRHWSQRAVGERDRRPAVRCNIDIAIRCAVINSVDELIGTG